MLCLTTPPASFDPCTTHVTSGDDSVVLSDILFGGVNSAKEADGINLDRIYLVP